MGLLRNRFRDRIRPPPGPPEKAPQPPLLRLSDDAGPSAAHPEPPQDGSRRRQQPPQQAQQPQPPQQQQSPSPPSPQPQPQQQQQQQQQLPRVSSATPPRSPLPGRLSGTFSRKMYGSTAGGRGSGGSNSGSGGGGRFSGSGALSMLGRQSRVSGDSSARSTIRDQASKFRRLLREGVPLGSSRDSAGSAQLDDVPDTADPFPDQLSDATFKIAAAGAAAGAATSPLGRPRASSSAAPPLGAQKQQQQRRGGSGTLPGHVALPLSAIQASMPHEVHPGETCSDGVVSFVVPPGWTATRTMDCFMLVNGLSIGFVRAAPAAGAAEALLEVERLQVMSHVTAMSSPVFEEDENGVFATVAYLSTMGKGRGIATFSDDFKGCACVFALCGPSEAEEMIAQSIRHLRGTVKPPAVPVCAKLTEAERARESAVRRDSEERRSVVSDLPGLSEPLARLEQDFKQKEASSSACVIQ